MKNPNTYPEIRFWTTAAERQAIALRHGVKSRGQVSNILLGKSANIPLLNALIKAAEENKALADSLKERCTALGPR